MVEKSNRKKVVIIGIIVVVVAALIGFRIYQNVSQTATTEETESTAVETAAVQMGTLEETTTLKGTLAGGREVDVPPQISGTVQSVNVAVGDYVTAGQTLCSIDNSNYQSNLLQAQANYNAALATANNAKANLARMQALYEEGAVSLQQVEQAQLAVDTSGVDAAAAQVQAAQQQIQNCVVTAPISGEVAAVNVQQGGMAASGGAVVRLVTVDDVKLVADVTESNINRVKEGDTVNVKIEAASEYDFIGKITGVAPAADAQTNLYPVEITISNASGLLKPGMFAEAQLVINRVDNVLMVPAEAVNTENCVFVLQADNTVKKVPVEVGISNENYVEIISGLELGQSVVTTGQHLLFDGAPVRDVTDVVSTEAEPVASEQETAN